MNEFDEASATDDAPRRSVADLVAAGSHPSLRAVRQFQDRPLPPGALEGEGDGLDHVRLAGEEGGAVGRYELVGIGLRF